MTTSLVTTGRPSLPFLRLTLAGWAGLVVFGALVLVEHGRDELVFAAITVGVALVMAGWLRNRQGRAVLVASLVVGGLQLLEQGGYSVADVTANDTDAGKTVVDLLGLVASAAVVAGAASGLRQRRRPR